MIRYIKSTSTSTGVKWKSNMIELCEKKDKEEFLKPTVELRLKRKWCNFRGQLHFLGRATVDFTVSIVCTLSCSPFSDF